MTPGPPGAAARHVWIDDEHLEVAGHRFHCRVGSTEGDLPVWKERHLVDAHLQALARLAPRAVVEIGVARGGSTALLALLAPEAEVVALELAEERIPALDDLLTELGATERVRVHHGVDQADRDAVRQRVLDRFPTGGIDLVVDDASHLLGPTRATFEALFPLVRPGGEYVVEDWSWEHLGAARLAAALEDLPPEDADELPGTTPIARRLGPRARARLGLPDGGDLTAGPFAALATGQPLSLLAIELLLATAQGHPAVGSIRIDGDWLVAVRGQAALDPTDFRITHLYEDHFGLLGPLALPSS